MNPCSSRRLATVLLVATLLAPAAFANGYAEEIELYRQFVRQRMEADGMPGMSVGFIKGDFQWAEGFGYSDLENKVPAKPESAYRLASVTKPMTAIAVLQLVEMGKIDLDAEVQAYVPYFPKKPWPVTVRGLLGHLGGVSHYRNYDEEGHFKTHKDTREAIAVFEDFDLVAEPGTEYNYTSYGYNLLGAVIEGASGTSYGEFLKQHLWGPLGMDATRMDSPDAVIPHRVRGYRRGPGGELINSEFVDISSRFAAGGTRSTVLDLLELARGMMAGEVLNAELADEMLTSMVTRDGRATDYGMGWGVGPINGRFSYGHSGGQAETRTYLICFPRSSFAIAFATNFEDADRSPFIQRLYHLIMGEPYLPRVVTADRAGDAVYRAMASVFGSGMSYHDRYGKASTPPGDDLDAAFAYFAEWTDEKTLASNLDEAQQKIGDGRHPVADRAFERLGSFMAAELAAAHGPERLQDLHRQGPVAFFDAYVERVGTGRKVPRRYRFDKRLARRIDGWHDDWAKVWDEEMQGLSFGPGADLDRVAERLAEKFAGASIYPDYVGRFEALAQDLFLSGDVPGAARVAEGALAVYPASDRAHFLSGLATLAGGQKEKAAAAFGKAKELDRGGTAGPGTLNGWAYRLRSAGHIALGLELLHIARDLYPEDANLYDSTAEFLLEMGEKEKAIAFYEKAIEVDPEFENARAMLEKIRSQPD